MILDDKLLQLRLQDAPEFLLRLHEVLVTWGLNEKPGLFLQARPAPASGLALDVDMPAVVDVLREGAEGQDNWWNGFESHQVQRSFHGVTGLTNWSEPDWLVEVHHDGHSLAGIWSFPQDKELTIPAWYDQFFLQFFELVARLARAGGLAGDFQVTATIVNANKLRFVARGHTGFAVAGQPCALKNVQWPVHSAPVGTPQWTKLARVLSAGIAGAYRHRGR